MATKNWTRAKLIEFRDRFKIKNALLSKTLDINPSTISLWERKTNDWLLPKKYWSKLDDWESVCLQIEEKNKEYQGIINPVSIGSTSAGILGLALGGPIGGILGMALGSLLNEDKKKQFVFNEPNLVNQLEKECPYCGEKIKVKATFCKHCQSIILRSIEYVSREDGYTYIEYDNGNEIQNSRINGLNSSGLKIFFKITIASKKLEALSKIKNFINDFKMSISIYEDGFYIFKEPNQPILKFESNDKQIQIQISGLLGNTILDIKNALKGLITELEILVEKNNISCF